MGIIDYSKIINKTVENIKPSGIRRFFDIASSMENVISLGVGEPDFNTPWQVRKAGINSLESGKTKYTSNKGNAKLVSEISKYMERKYAVKYKPMLSKFSILVVFVKPCPQISAIFLFGIKGCFLSNIKIT